MPPPSHPHYNILHHVLSTLLLKYTLHVSKSCYFHHHHPSSSHYDPPLNTIGPLTRSSTQEPEGSFQNKMGILPSPCLTYISMASPCTQNKMQTPRLRGPLSPGSWLTPSPTVTHLLLIHRTLATRAPLGSEHSTSFLSQTLPCSSQEYLSSSSLRG